MNSAADNLVGLNLDGEWVVTEKITKAEHATGSHFSICYKVQRDGAEYFLKAYKYEAFQQLARFDKQAVDIIKEMTDAFIYERDLSQLCRDRGVTKVSFVLDSGQVYVQGHPISLVPYLIFDLADGDVRSKIALSDDIDAAWKFRSLHNIAIAIKQLHAIEVSHQDIKPSNILVFDEVHKVGDLGRSVSITIPTELNNLAFTGDRGYAPPEALYGFSNAGWHSRAFAIDCYLLGGGGGGGGVTWQCSILPI